MKTYAVKVREILCDVVLIDAEDEGDALDKAQEYNVEVGFDLNNIEDYTFKVLGEATVEDYEYYGKVEV